MLKGWSSSELVPLFAAEQVPNEAELARFAEWFAELCLLAPLDSSAQSRGRARLLAAVSEPSERFAPLFGKLSEFFDLSTEALRSVFVRAALASEWQPGPLPWVSLFHLEGGPAVRGLDTGLVRLKKGMPFPPHRHTGSERVLVLEGGYHDHEQRWYGPGDVHDMIRGTEHALHMNAEHDVLLAVILSGEIQVLAG